MRDVVVRAIIEVNQTDQIGDGKIFVCPLERCLAGKNRRTE